MTRLTDDDKKFLGITYGKVTWRAFRLVLKSKSEDHEVDSCQLTFYIFGWVFRINLPDIIKSVRYKVRAAWDQATIERMGRDWYYEEFTKEYGFSLDNGFLQLFYGIQNPINHYSFVDNEGYLSYNAKDITKTYTELTSKSKSWFLPWTEYRTTEYRLYDDKNQIYCEIKNNKGISLKDYIHADTNCPTVSFKIKDYDGTEIIAKTMIEETVYKRGIKHFKWISLFTKNLNKRVLKISYSDEVGPGKGDWKGGIMAENFDASNCEDHLEAIKAFCQKTHTSKYRKYKLEFVGLA